MFRLPGWLGDLSHYKHFSTLLIPWSFLSQEPVTEEGPTGSGHLGIQLLSPVSLTRQGSFLHSAKTMYGLQIARLAYGKTEYDS